MSNQSQFTIENLCKYMNQGKLMAAKCVKCGEVHFPPRPICDRCLSKDFEWTEIPPRGELLTYTIIHIAPAQFQSMAPYAVGIVQFENGVKIPGMLRGVPLDKIKIGMPLAMSFESCSATGQWPRWPRYFFTLS